MSKDKALALYKSIRPPFLILTPVCVFLAYCTALKTQNQLNLFDLFLVLLGALSAHISVNTLNEYFDFKSGLDAKTIKTPFSGGSGALIENVKAANAVFILGMTSLISTTVIGLYFIYQHGLSILPIGIIGVLLILTYTQWINRQPLLCLIAPGLGFGPIMVGGTYLILTGEYSLFSFYVSLIPFFLVNNLLLLNQYPDISADKSVGRKHFPITYGIKFSNVVYGVFVLATCLTTILGIYLDLFPTLSLIALLPMFIALITLFGISKYANEIDELIPYMGLNVLVALTTPILMGISLILG